MAAFVDPQTMARTTAVLLIRTAGLTSCGTPKAPDINNLCCTLLDEVAISRIRSHFSAAHSALIYFAARVE